ncbi:MAG: hypothetical protein F6J86_28865 [Symploca sp. SIO1B1]|nr:hypothetical protein [Symploca sp. SIO2D2]NER97810.1 hypothetical protein [Symploca sp. SIO1B1]
MTEGTSQYRPKFEDDIKSAVVGERNFIFNYFYYSQDIKSVESKATTVDDQLPCPYRGLFHFGPNDAEVFFGREIFIEELYSATQTRNFIPVLGASGSGKSSVVLAGLVPKLQQEGHWKFTHFRPGSDPFHALALALVPLYTPELDNTDQIAQARKLAGYLKDNTIPLSDVFAKIQQNCLNHRVLLIADQFEELYTLCNEEIQRKFLDCLLTCLGNSTYPSSLATVLVTTMRADFLGNALAYPEFADQLREADVKIRSMNSQELRSVIEKPVERLGVTFEAGLVERILNDVEEQPGNLPLLEFALTELWNKRTGKQLTHQVYENIGEVEGALARHADDKYGNLTDEDKEKVRRIFIQLVRPGEGTEDTRRVALKEELGEQSWSLVTQLADARLVVTSRNGSDQETVEVVHEALIRNWDELQAWMNTDRVFRAWQERLRAAKKQWEAKNKDPGSLWRGAALAEAAEKLSERPEDLIYESEFIQQSIQEQKRENQETEARRRRNIRTAWGITVGSLVAVAIITGFFLRGRYQQKQAELNQADSLARYSLSLLDKGKEFEASIEAIRAGKILQKHKDYEPELMRALIANIYESRELYRLQGYSEISFSPDGKVFATIGEDDTIKLWDMETVQEIRTLQVHRSEVTPDGSMSFSPDGKILAATYFHDNTGQTVKLWDVETGQEIRTLQVHYDDYSPLSLSFSSNSNILVTAGGYNLIKLWDVETGQEIRTLQKDDDFFTYNVSLSPDGKTLATSREDKTIKLWDIETGQEIRTLQGHDDSVLSVSFSPDGKTLASGSGDETIKLWNIETGQEIRTLHGHNGWVWSVSFSPDGKTFATGSKDKTVKLWDVETSQEIRTLQGHDNSILSVSFSPDGSILASQSSDDTIKLWKMETSNKDYYEGVFVVSFSPDGKTFAVGGWDNTIELWDAETGQRLRRLQRQETEPKFRNNLIYKDLLINSVSFSPDGNILATGSSDKTIKLWDIETGQEIRTLRGHNQEVNSVSFNPDGNVLATGSGDKTIKLWDVEMGQEIRTLQGQGFGFVYSVSFSPDGNILATGSSDKTIKLWDVETGQEIRTLGQGWVNNVSFSPNGNILAASGNDNTIKLWDVEMGQEIRTLQGHNESVNSISFSPDGNILATGSRDQTIKLWDVETGQEISTLQGHNASVTSVSFNPDGNILVTASKSSNKPLILWNLDLDSLMERSCDRVRNYLQHNPKVTEEDRSLCDGIGTEK